MFQVWFWFMCKFHLHFALPSTSYRLVNKTQRILRVFILLRFSCHWIWFMFSDTHKKICKFELKEIGFFFSSGSPEELIWARLYWLYYFCISLFWPSPQYDLTHESVNNVIFLLKICHRECLWYKICDFVCKPLTWLCIAPLKVIFFLVQ